MCGYYVSLRSLPYIFLALLTVLPHCYPHYISGQVSHVRKIISPLSSHPHTLTPTEAMASRQNSSGKSGPPSRTSSNVKSGPPSRTSSSDSQTLTTRQNSGSSITSTTSREGGSPKSMHRETSGSSIGPSGSLTGQMPPKTLRSNSNVSTASGRVPSIPVPVNRPEMEMLCPLSPTSMKAARRPVIGPEMVR